MLFRETLDDLSSEVEEAVDELFQAVKRNQSHEQDLLLVELNGFHDKNIQEVKYSSNLSPFDFGPGGWRYLSDFTQYRFYDFYRRKVISTSRLAYFSDYYQNKHKQNVYDITLQMELMVYLKFWESDVVLTKLYHLSNLAQGKNFDWFFSISKDDSRQILIRTLIRDSIKNICPKYYKLIKDVYLSQIRNAAAHSQFYIAQDMLGFNNYNPSDHAPLSQITFKQWEDRFHKLVLFYSSLIKWSNVTQKEYVSRQSGKHFGLDVRITERDGPEKHKWIKYVDTGGRVDWMWYDNWNKYYKDAIS